MGKVKDPNWVTGKQGKNWSASLRQAHKAGAVICVEETGVPVTWERRAGSKYLRPWIDQDGNRYDSYDCIPVF